MPGRLDAGRLLEVGLARLVLETSPGNRLSLAPESVLHLLAAADHDANKRLNGSCDSAI